MGGSFTVDLRNNCSLSGLITTLFSGCQTHLSILDSVSEALSNLKTLEINSSHTLRKSYLEVALFHLHYYSVLLNVSKQQWAKNQKVMPLALPAFMTLGKSRSPCFIKFNIKSWG